jgi:putative oxidoreductase
MITTARFSRRTELVLTLLRVVTGLILMAHGVQKLGAPAETARSFAGMGIPFPEVAVVLAIIGEFVGGLGLALGALTRIAALGPLFTMLVAVSWVHFSKGLFAESGGFEYPLTLLLVSLVFVVHGGGPYSLDAWVARMRKQGRSGPAIGERVTPRQPTPLDAELRPAP